MPPKNPSTPGSKSTPTPKHVPPTVKLVRDHLAINGMWFEHAAYDNHLDLQNKVNGILNATPGMDMTAESAVKIRDFMKAQAVTNENSLLDDLVKLLIKTTKVVPQKHDLDGRVKEVMDSLLDKIAVDQDLVTEGLHPVRDKLYVRGFLPPTTISNKAVGLSDPKPDTTWGLEIPQYPIPGEGIALLEPDVEAMVKVCPEVQHAFCAVEFGSCEKSLEQVENQSIRTGADFVEARRQLNAKAAAAKQAREPQPPSPKPSVQQADKGKNPESCPEPSSEPQADLESIAFTVSWVPQMAKLHVHWHESNIGPTGIWHMTMLNAYMFCREQSLKEFRHDLGNILSWGVLKRKFEVEKIMKDIYPNY
ncbi:MAG: hypothetical protein Q9170_008363 [Blastenia crenularia]